MPVLQPSFDRPRFANSVAALLAGAGYSHARTLLWAFDTAITRHVPALEFVLAVTVSAWLAGMILHDLFGRAGPLGWATGFAGAVIATGLAAGIAGYLTLPPQRLETVILAIVMTGATPLFMAWLAAVAPLLFLTRALRVT